MSKVGREMRDFVSWQSWEYSLAWRVVQEGRITLETASYTARNNGRMLK